MQVQNTNNVQFGARYVCPATIKVKTGGRRWKDAQVNFIKFSTSKPQDVSFLEGVEELWGNKNLSSGIVDEVHIFGGKAQIYGITTQTSGFDTVDAKKVLGLISTDKISKGEAEVGVYKIGTNPKYAYAQNKKKRDVKHIATAMYESVKRLANKAGSSLVAKGVESEDAQFLSKLGLNA